MFNSCSSLTNLIATNFNTTNCETFTSMFTSIKSLTISINKEANYKLIERFNGDLTVTNE